jgi:hypothetical protein
MSHVVPCSAGQSGAVLTKKYSSAGIAGKKEIRPARKNASRERQNRNGGRNTLDVCEKISA